MYGFVYSRSRKEKGRKPRREAATRASRTIPVSFSGSAASRALSAVIPEVLHGGESRRPLLYKFVTTEPNVVEKREPKVAGTHGRAASTELCFHFFSLSTLTVFDVRVPACERAFACTRVRLRMCASVPLLSSGHVLIS